MSGSVLTSDGSRQGMRVRPAGESDVPDISTALAAAFVDDPVFSYCYPERAWRQQMLPAWFEAVVTTYLANDAIYTTTGIEGGAIWVPDGSGDDDHLGATLARISGQYAETLFTIFELMAAKHPQEPHHYLFLVGTRPESQSRGIGSALIEPMLETCDRNEMPAYLEATSEGSKRLYLRLGFEVVDEIILPGGPSMWPMWRTPDARPT